MGLDRKRKSIDALQSSDKKKKSIIENKSSSSEDSDDQSDHDNGLIDEEVKNDIPAISRWPQDDIQKLLSQIESVLPKNDNNSFRSRVTKLDWAKVQFNNYSKDECQATWIAIQDQLRTFKTLGDLVHDAKNMLATKGIDTYQSKLNRVSKPRSAYMLYYMEILPKYKKKHPDFKLPQLTQVIAEKYKNLLPEKKQPFIDQAQKLKTEYNELVGKTNEGFKSKPKVNHNTKPKSPFQVFLESKFAELNGQFDKAELQNHFKDKWDSMSEKKKSKWIKLAQEREQTYLNTLKEDHKNDPKFTMPTKSALTKSDRIILDAQSGKPKKPPANNYSLYSKEMLQGQTFADVAPKERMALLAKQWKTMSDEERQMYSDKLKVITERYKTEYDAYLKTLPEEERQKELGLVKSKLKKPEPKVVPRINAREGIQEKVKKKPGSTSKYNSKSKSFENEPKAVPFKNAFDLFKSKFKENPKFKPKKPIEPQAVIEWNTMSERKKAVFENDLKSLKKDYMKKLKGFLKSLSEDDLKLYLKLRKPELVSGNTDKESDDDSSTSENENDSSDEESDDDDDNDDDDDDDDEDDNNNDD